MYGSVLLQMISIGPADAVKLWARRIRTAEKTLLCMLVGQLAGC
jgi:hypothetical protein